MLADPRSFVAGDAERIVAEWSEIALVPAPDGAEGARAELIAGFARAAGATGVGFDRVGNVVVTVDGEDAAGESLTYLATMDDLGSIAEHRARSDVLYRDGDRLVGPCTETTSSDASALAIIRYALAGDRPWRRLTVAFVLGEETGLRGARALVAERGADLGSVIDLMGGIGTVSWNAIGFAGLEVTFSATPRHSLDGGVSEVSAAIARFVSALHADVPASSADAVTLRRVNRVAAGSLFNWSPDSGSVTVDIRSTDATVLAQLADSTRLLAEDAARAAGVRVRFAAGQTSPAITLPGGRDHRLVTGLADAIRFAGYEPRLRPHSSSNVNVVYEAGLEGVVHDGLERGGGRGTPHEWCNIPRVIAGVVADCELLRRLCAP